MIVKEAPFTLLIAVAIVSGLVWAAMKWRYEGIIDSLRERLAGKDQQLDDYRERLSFTPARGSEYSRMTQKELKGVALSLASEIRAWVNQRSVVEDERSSAEWAALSDATDEARRKELWQAATSEAMRRSQSFTSEYDAKFKARAIVIRDEVSTRIGAMQSSRRAPIDGIFEHPTNPIGARMVADHLEILATNLT